MVWQVPDVEQPTWGQEAACSLLVDTYWFLHHKELKTKRVKKCKMDYAKYLT